MTKEQIKQIVKLTETIVNKRLNEMPESNPQEHIQSFYKAMKRVGLTPNLKSISVDDNYPSSIRCDYQSHSVFSVKTFSDIEKLTGARLTFLPNSNGLLIWYNY